MGNRDNNEQAVVTEDEAATDDKNSRQPEPADAPRERDSETVKEAAEETVEAEPVAGSADDESGVKDLQKELEVARQDAGAYRDKALRAQAELQNMQKRASRDIENAHKYALEKFLGDLLPVLDSMELGIDASGNGGDVESLREGMDLTLKMFRDTLAKAGIKVIDPQGEKFNPEQHEAVSMQESSESKSGTVISVMQKGYELNGRLIRPAMVIVAK